MLKLFRAAPFVLLLALGLFASDSARAQGCGEHNPNCIVPTAPPGTSNNQAASTAFVQEAVGGGGGVLAVPNGGTGDTSFTANLPLIGNGTSPVTQGTRSGNTTSFATTNGGLTSGNCVKIDALGNFVDAGSACGTGAGNTPFVQDFLSGTNFTPGTTTSLTLSSAPAAAAILTITFDGISQNANTWSLSGAVVTFDAAIPLNTQVVEAKWSTSSTVAGVSSLTAGGTSVSGGINLVPGGATSITASGQNITIGNDISMVSIMDPAFGAKCNAVLVSSGTATISSGSPNLTVSAASFTAADASNHKSIWIPGAGVAGAGLSTTIQTFTDATHVVLAANASTTVTAASLSQSSLLVYGTDDTAAIQAAINATPNFGTLFINPATLGFPVVGCLIKQTGATGVALTVNHPINIKGGGNLSALITDPSMGTTVIGIHAPQSGVNWNGIVWDGWTLGTNINFVPFTRYGLFGIWFDATSAGAGGFLGVTVQNLRLGESSGDFSLMMDGVGSQGNRFINNTIWGGLELNNVIDSNIVDSNRFQGASIFGVNVIMAGGNFQFTHNSVTAAGGLCIAAATGGILMPLIQDNYFEENSLTPPQFQHNSFVDIGCSAGVSTIVGAEIHDNIIANIVSSTTTAIKIDPSTASTTILSNFIANNNGRTAVLNNGTSTNCGPNHFQTSATLTNGSGTFANACTNY